MKTLIAAATFSSEMSGVQRHAFNAVRSLLLREEMREVHLVVAPWQHEFAKDMMSSAGARLMIHAVETGNSSISRNAWYYGRLPQLARKLNVELVHLAYPVPVNARSFSCPVVVTLHDMYPYEIPDNFGFPKFLVNRMILQQCLRAVDGIACVSETTRQRMRKYVPERLNENAVCIPNCVLPMPKAVEPAAADCHSKPFLLCVAQHRRNKNIPLLVRSFARMAREGRIDSRMQLLIIGIPGPETERIRRLVAECELGMCLRFLTGLSEAELHWCYVNCEALVAPSSVEGFGLPVAEALLAGCRVVCSDIDAHREIASDSCQFVNVNGYAEQMLAEAIAAALSGVRPEPMSLPQFSTEAIGAQYIRFYRGLIEARTFAGRRGLAVPVRGI